ncbi:cobalamin biosynthesis protein [Endozoicomonas sp. G2_1]|uniref:cobalamin biosynthesis protein CobD/CbiB n=1 Tax=Endozoicomonas sp. G2_1 TaxID=2821091 RepID=UPI001ADC40A7|nr:cobalamin biosynthesis protein [Endozoicomonas sp. G2_1]MBO9490883.1 cobalamin biosynthesis protein [Endozoicomonas sp. G2_1]
MAEFFTSLPSLSQACLLAVSVYLLKALLSHYLPHRPLAFFTFFCQLLANKVNRRDNASNQQKLSGTIAIVVSLAPVVIILWLFADFIEVIELWHGLLLYLALGGFGISHESKAMAQALVAKQNYVAKQTLQTRVLRDTSELSTMGLAKANIEMQLLTFAQQQVMIIGYFLLFGPLFALSCRLLLEMHYSWNHKQDSFRYFGQPIAAMVNLLQWPFSKTLGLLVLFSTIQQNLVLHWRLSKQHLLTNNNNFLLHNGALALGVQLAGVAIYQGKKLRRDSFNQQARQPEIRDIIAASRLVRLQKILLSVILLFIAIVPILLS